MEEWRVAISTVGFMRDVFCCVTNLFCKLTGNQFGPKGTHTVTNKTQKISLDFMFNSLVVFEIAKTWANVLSSSPTYFRDLVNIKSLDTTCLN